MKHFLIVIAAAFVAAATAAAPPASAQGQGGVITERDVVTQPVIPAPDNGEILVRIGVTSRIYFKYPFKAIRLEDDLSVKAVPQSDHIVAFTGLSPGRSRVTIETTDGRTDAWGLVTVVRDPHEVKIYVPAPSRTSNGNGGSGITIVNNAGAGAVAQSSDTPADYHSVLCNEVSCTPPPEPK